MAKVNKVYPSFYNGVSQQSSELILDTNCREMVNCLPSLISGLSKRPPIKYVANLLTTADKPFISEKVFHSYDRGEDDEEYLFSFVQNSNVVDDISINSYNLDGSKNVVTFKDDVAKQYLSGGNIKALTVQDTTWIINLDKEVGTELYSPPSDINFDKTAYYWLSRSSSDVNNTYNYAVYINNVVIEKSGDKSDVVAEALTQLINENVEVNTLVKATVQGSLIKIEALTDEDFTFSSWDSWGNQASFGWKGRVNKLTDLPKDFTFEEAYIEISGDDTDNFTTYYVKWNGSSWEETYAPDLEVFTLTNMPVSMSRVGLENGVSTFEISSIEWSTPKVGNTNNNGNPSFVGNKLKDLVFYKNRFGVVSNDSLVLSVTADYYDFYIKTVLEVIDTDPIDISIASNTASSIQYVKPFNNSLYLFTKDSQFELLSEGYLSPLTVSIESVTNYPISNVEPKVVNNSLFFISKTGGRQQLREYIKDETLTVKGVDLNITTPTYLEEDITSIHINGVLGIVLCCTNSNVIYVYNYTETGTERVQSAWSKWKILDTYIPLTTYDYNLISNNLLVTMVCDDVVTGNHRKLYSLKLDDNQTATIDIARSGNDIIQIPYKSEILLPNVYPHISTIGTPKDKMLLKKVSINGEGNFSAKLYRKDYKTEYIKEHSDSMMKDLDLHISSKVDNVDIYIFDNTPNNFVINSIVIEGMYTSHSRAIK